MGYDIGDLNASKNEQISKNLVPICSSRDDLSENIIYLQQKYIFIFSGAAIFVMGYDIGVPNASKNERISIYLVPSCS